ncbi:MAG: hypothetical protein DMF08_10785 [Verrucomicrobia bacterium]|nr:MAG: hypothetical protein DMF08_10785 [Verrucomicrobiota bacterium]
MDERDDGPQHLYEVRPRKASARVSQVRGRCSCVWGREGTPVETLHKAKNNYNMTLVKIRNPIS